MRINIIAYGDFDNRKGDRQESLVFQMKLVFLSTSSQAVALETFRIVI